MRNLNNSFLFFYLLIAVFSCNWNTDAQQTIDSSYYYYPLILNPRNNSDHISALAFYNKHKNKSLQAKDTLVAVQDLRLIAIAQKKFGFFYESENSAIEALKLLDKLKTNDSIITEERMGLLNHLGLIYQELEMYDKAIEFYDKALKSIKNQKYITTILNNKALIFFKQKKYDLAIRGFNKVYENNLISNDTIKIARALDNLGTAQSKINNSMALSNIMKGLKLRQNKKYTPGIYTSYLHLAEYYKDRGVKSEALIFANKALDIAKTSNNLDQKENALSMIVSLIDDSRVSEYKSITDSISKMKQIQKNTFAAMKYDFTQYEKKARESEISKEKEKRLRLLYQGIGALILLSSIFLYVILKSKHKKEKIQQVYTTETRISKKVHDEVANDIYHAMTKLQRGSSVKEDILDDLERVYIKTRDISKENSTIDFKEDFATTLNDLLVSYKDDAVNVITRNLTNINWNSISELKKTAIYRVLQELMTNMKKHSKASIAAVTFNKEKTNIVINYKDDGVGCDLKKKSGLQNAENRILSVNGTIIFESKSNSGFKATIKI